MRSLAPACCLLLLLLTACVNDVDEVQRVLDEVDQSNRYYDITATYSDSAVIRVSVTAPEMTSRMIAPGQQEDRFEGGIAVDFFGDLGEATGRLTAGHAVNRIREEVITMTDSVVLVSTSGDTLRSEELIYDAKRQLLYTTGIFRYTGKEEDIYGYRFKTDPNFERYSYDKMSGVMSNAVGLPG